MNTRIVFETHSTSEDNERGVASGWHHSQLSVRGRQFAQTLGERRRADGIVAVFSSDLKRAVETAHIAFDGTDILVLSDWRLRECDYGEMNGKPAAEVHGNRRQFLDIPYPGGESWRFAIARVGRFLNDLPLRWEGQRILVIGHVATRWAFEHLLNGIPLEELAVSEFQWREGWEYDLRRD